MYVAGNCRFKYSCPGYVLMPVGPEAMAGHSYLGIGTVFSVARKHRCGRELESEPRPPTALRTYYPVSANYQLIERQSSCILAVKYTD